MKKISSFLFGSASTFGLAEAIGIHPEVADQMQSAPVDSTDAIISIIGGAVSTIIVQLLKRWWQKQDHKKSDQSSLELNKGSNSP
jgi:phosphate/sulfate permease